MNVKIKDLKVTGFNNSGIFPDQSAWRISLYEMIIPTLRGFEDV